MTTLDDKLLGERRENYCSSSEGEENEEEEEEKSGSSPDASRRQSVASSKIDINSKARWEGYSQNTGPKGVIRDWQLFKEHEARTRKENERTLVEEAKRASITCRSYADDVKNDEKPATAEDEDDLDKLLSDDVLQEFVKKRMNAMIQPKGVPKAPGVVHAIGSADEFLTSIEDADPSVPVVIHIHENTRVCSRMNECLIPLACSHPRVQFCSVAASCVGVSSLFRSKGVPALLVYKGGNLIGNFVQLGEEFGQEFYEGDVENFLIENGMIGDPGDKPIVLN